MFARNVSIRLKQNSSAEFTSLLEKNILPLLQKQPGFRDLILLAGDDPKFMTTISLWETKEQADTYNNTAYPEILKTLGNLLDGPPKVRTSTVLSSTLHKLSTAAA